MLRSPGGAAAALVQQPGHADLAERGSNKVERRSGAAVSGGRRAHALALDDVDRSISYFTWTLSWAILVAPEAVEMDPL